MLLRGKDIFVYITRPKPINKYGLLEQHKLSI